MVVVVVVVVSLPVPVLLLQHYKKELKGSMYIFTVQGQAKFKLIRWVTESDTAKTIIKALGWCCDIL
eukprot:scaffold15902_cov160-Skeletonema_dohrnii-CCMP3373.AAC.1